MSNRKYVSQSDVPAYGLEDALRVAKAIADNFGKNPTRPLQVARAMELSPGSSTFRVLTGSSIAFGLTEGGYNADEIALTPLGRRIVAPTQEGDELAARREAVLRPRILREFLTRYDGSKLPPDEIACNVLEEMEVPGNRTSRTFSLIVDSAEDVGFLTEIKGDKWVDLEGGTEQPVNGLPNPSQAEVTDVPTGRADGNVEKRAETKDSQPLRRAGIRKHGRVFITHGQNRAIVEQLKELLRFGGFTPIVALEQESASKPVPEKVLDEMRSCEAAIIHVGTERKVMDSDGAEHLMLNHNVLIEIGAAMAFYGGKFILLVEQGVPLPSNLQGLYEVRYEGNELGYESTMRLLKAFNDFRS